MESKNNIRKVCPDCGDTAMEFFHETGGLQKLLMIARIQKEIYVKCAFKDEFGVEHMWIRFSMYDSKSNNIVGTLDNIPITVKYVKNGDVVSVPASKISNFMYFENGANYSYVPL